MVRLEELHRRNQHEPIPDGVNEHDCCSVPIAGEKCSCGPDLVLSTIPISEFKIEEIERVAT
jgi:hypothetical protein